jgi:hypothetical protein
LPKKTLTLASAKGADVLVQVKANQPGLLAACEDLAHHCTPTQCDVQHDKRHGRVETRTVHTYDLPPDWLPEGWQPLAAGSAGLTYSLSGARRAAGT